MSLDFVMRKSGLPALFFITFCFSACSPHCHQWKLAIIKADCPPARYAKLYLPACSTFNGFDAVLIRANGCISFYLNALTLCFPNYGEDPDHTEVVFCIDDEVSTFIADKLQGGQSLLLPEEAMQLVVSAMLQQKCVDITIGRYQTTLIPDHFDTSYNKFF